MDLRRSLKRFVHGTDAPFVAAPTPPAMPAGPVTDVDPAWFDDDAGMVARYARRRAALPTSPAPQEMSPVVAIGRGTPEHDAAIAGHLDQSPSHRRRRGRRGSDDTLRQRLIAATLALLLCLLAFPAGASAQQRYRVQPGDTLASVAAEFGVDPEAILRSSWLANPPELSPGDVIVIPDPGQAPAEAAAEAAINEGTSPWTSGVYWVEDGDTVEAIAAAYGVGLDDLLSLNGLAEDDYIYPGQRLLIPGRSEPVDAAAANGLYPYAQVRVPIHRQEHSLSCEYASVFIATGAFGDGIPESVFLDAIPVTSNPHYGFRGDIDGVWGGYTDYGIYPEPLVPILNDAGYVAEVFYSDGDPSQLIAHLDAGHPVVVWLAFWGDTGKVYKDEGRYTVFAGDHVMTAYGYDDEFVYFSDPASGSYRALDWGTFLWMWRMMDGMSLAIYPV